MEYLIWIILAISFIILIVNKGKIFTIIKEIFLLLTTRRNRDNNSLAVNESTQIQELNEQPKDKVSNQSGFILIRIESLESNVTQLNQKFDEQLQLVGSKLLERINKLEGKLHELEYKCTSSPDNGDQESGNDENSSFPKTWYVGATDSNNINVFNFKDFSNTIGARLIEITQYSDIDGTYNLIINQESRKTIIANFRFGMNQICDVERLPTDINQEIRIIRKGRIRRNGNTWLIVEKLQLEFVNI